MYTERFYMQGPVGAAQSLLAAATIAEFFPPEKGEVESLSFTVSTTLNSAAPTVISFYSRTNIGNAAGEVLLGTITIPSGAVAGKTYVNRITPVYLNQGLSIAAVVTTVATVAGAGYAAATLSLSPENENNETNVVLVAS
jgi:hypothetical protein